MIIPDITLLVYAHNDQAPAHAAARKWWESLMNGTTPVGMPWLCLSGYVRLMTHPRVLVRPMEVEDAVGHVRQWLARPVVRVIHPGSRFADLFFGFLGELGSAGNLTTDAQLAALAVENQADLHSCDTDFARFPGLRWLNPLEG